MKKTSFHLPFSFFQKKVHANLLHDMLLGEKNSSKQKINLDSAYQAVQDFQKGFQTEFEKLCKKNRKKNKLNQLYDRFKKREVDKQEKRLATCLKPALIPGKREEVKIYTGQENKDCSQNKLRFISRDSLQALWIFSKTSLKESIEKEKLNQKSFAEEVFEEKKEIILVNEKKLDEKKQIKQNRTSREHQQINSQKQKVNPFLTSAKTEKKTALQEIIGSTSKKKTQNNEEASLLKSWNSSISQSKSHFIKKEEGITPNQCLELFMSSGKTDSLFEVRPNTSDSKKKQKDKKKQKPRVS